jgi:hypothetical protein
MHRVEVSNTKVNTTKKIGIIAGVGDHRDEDIRECAILQPDV